MLCNGVAANLAASSLAEDFSLGAADLGGENRCRVDSPKVFETGTQLSCGAVLHCGNFFRSGLGHNLRTPLVGERNKFIYRNMLTNK